MAKFKPELLYPRNSWSRKVKTADLTYEHLKEKGTSNLPGYYIDTVFNKEFEIEEGEAVLLGIPNRNGNLQYGHYVEMVTYENGETYRFKPNASSKNLIATLKPELRAGAGDTAACVRVLLAVREGLVSVRLLAGMPRDISPEDFRKLLHGKVPVPQLMAECSDSYLKFLTAWLQEDRRTL